MNTFQLCVDLVRFSEFNIGNTSLSILVGSNYLLSVIRTCWCADSRFFFVIQNIQLKHSIGRAGVPMEVMGLMLGQFVDDYTVRVIDVFAMPQSGTVSQ